jgi:hypothetical protein
MALAMTLAAAAIVFGFGAPATADGYCAYPNCDGAPINQPGTCFQNGQGTGFLAPCGQIVCSYGSLVCRPGFPA